MKKIKFKIIGVIIGIVCLSGIAFAINTISTGYRTTSSYKVIKNKQVKHTGSNSYFVPTKTDYEWNNFVSHKPSDVSIIDNNCGKYIGNGIFVQLSDLGKKNWGNAKYACLNSKEGGCSDWYLPTISELGILYRNKDNIGGFSNDWYWSSSDYELTDGAGDAWNEHFSDGESWGRLKGAGESVRCIRKP